MDGGQDWSALVRRERWAVVPEFQAYEVSTCGRLRRRSKDGMLHPVAPNSRVINETTGAIRTFYSMLTVGNRTLQRAVRVLVASAHPKLKPVPTFGQDWLDWATGRPPKVPAAKFYKADRRTPMFKCPWAAGEIEGEEAEYVNLLFF